MTMQEQELTLFGGWAKVRIPPPIVNGVDVHSAMPSVSISTEIQPAFRWPIIQASSVKPHVYLSTRGGDTPASPVISNLTTRDNVIKLLKLSSFTWMRPDILSESYPVFIPVEIQEASFSYETRREVINLLDPTEEPEGESRFTRWRAAIQRTWIDRAFIRFFEIWEKGSLDTIVRGCAGTQVLRRSFSGKIGAHHHTGYTRQPKPLIKLENGEWALNKQAPSMGFRIPSLSPEGRQTARALAYRLRQQRNSNT